MAFDNAELMAKGLMRVSSLLLISLSDGSVRCFQVEVIVNGLLNYINTNLRCKFCFSSERSYLSLTRTMITTVRGP